MQQLRVIMFFQIKYVPFGSVIDGKNEIQDRINKHVLKTLMWLKMIPVTAQVYQWQEGLPNIWRATNSKEKLESLKAASGRLQRCTLSEETVSL